MQETLAWWFVLEVLGLLALPFVYAGLSRLPDRGLAFAKPLGLLLCTYTVWLLGTLRLVPAGRGAASLALVLLAVIGLVLIARSRGRFGAFLREQRKALVLYEVVFAAALAAWAVVRAFNPQIDSTEKPMDFAMLNAAFRATSFPPEDPWLAGHAVNYYYFGYLAMAVLTHLSGVAPSVGYNLGLATTFGAAAVGAWGLVANLIALRSGPTGPVPLRTLLWGGLGPVLLVLLGNLEGVLEVVRARGGGSPEFWAWIGIKKEMVAEAGRQVWALLGVPPLDPPRLSESWVPPENWWWWRATRVIDTLRDGQSLDYTITEFPFFSFLLGDLHPHVMALPFGLLVLILALDQMGRPAGLMARLRESLGGCVLMVLALGSIGFVNGWDLVPYGGLVVAAGVLGTWTAVGFRRPARWADLAAWVLFLAAGALVAYAPFYAPLAAQVLAARGNEAVQVSGLPVGIWMGPGTRPVHFLLVFGPLLVLSLGLLAAAATVVARKRGRFLVLGLLLASAGVLAGAEAAGMAAPAESPDGGVLGVLRKSWYALPLAAAIGLILGLGWSDNSSPASTGMPAGSPSPSPSPLPSPIKGEGTMPQQPEPEPETSTVAEPGIEGEGTMRRRPELGPSRATASVTEGEGTMPEWPEERRARPLAFALLVVAAACALFLGSEFFHVRDVFGNRMNTVFKLYYQAWTFLAVAGGFAVYYVDSCLGPRSKWVWRGFAVLLLAAGAVYPSAAVISKTDGFRGPPTLDGLAYLEQMDPGEARALRWLSSQPRIPGQVVLEATGGQYSRFGRVSSSTGIPTLLGWAGHEVQWRGSDRLLRGRAEQIDAIYNAVDKTQVVPLLRELGVQFVYVGSLERGKYSGDRLAGFDGVLDVAFRDTAVTIYRLPPDLRAG